MKKALLFGLFLFVLPIFSQSDCGNCWVVGGGCDLSVDCGSFPGQGVCHPCIFYVDCDNHSCAYNTGWFCYCNPTTPTLAPTATCLDDQIKHAVLKQKLVNRVAMLNVERKENAKRVLFGFRISFLR